MAARPWRDVRWGDARVIADVVYATFMFEALKRVVSLPRLVRGATAVRVRPRPTDPARVARVVRAVLRRVYRHDYCLPQSLALYRALVRSGLTPQLQMGVRMGGEDLEGHAWVVLDGSPLPDVTDPSAFSSTFVYPLQPS